MKNNNNDLIIQLIKDGNLELLKAVINEMQDIAANIFTIPDFQDPFIMKQPHQAEKIIPTSSLSLLHVASRYNSLECFKYLHEEKHIPLDHLSNDKFIPLQYACYFGSTDVALYILNEDPNECKFHTDENNFMSIFLCAVFGGKIGLIQELLNKGAKITDPWIDQYNLFVKSINLKRNDFLQLLYSLRSPDFTTPPNSKSLAMVAVSNHNLQALEIVYNKETDLTYQCTSDNRHAYFIEEVLDTKDLRFKDFLLKNAESDISFEPPEIPGHPQSGLCHWLCKYCDVDVAKAFFKTKDFNINRFDRDHRTGAYILTNKRNEAPDMLECLIENGLDVNLRYDNNTPSLLQCFVSGINKDYESIKLLIKYGADVNTPYVKHGLPPDQWTTIYLYVMNSSRDKRLKDIFSKKDE